MHVAVRDSWTDERLDDLNEKVGEGFADVDKRFDKLEDRFEGLQKEMNLRFEGLQRVLIYALVGTFGAVVSVLVALIGLILAQG